MTTKQFLGTMVVLWVIMTIAFILTATETEAAYYLTPAGVYDTTSESYINVSKERLPFMCSVGTVICPPARPEKVTKVLEVKKAEPKILATSTVATTTATSSDEVLRQLLIKKVMILLALINAQK